MPSAKVAQQMPNKALIHEVQKDPMKACLSAMEKKLRNLEKRKTKLLTYNDQLKQGTELNEEQKKSAEDLILVENSMLTIRELLKNIQTLELEHIKFSKKEAKRLKAESISQDKQKVEQTTTKLLEIQLILSKIDEEAREDFLNEQNGACLLKEEELDALDKVFGYLNPEDDEQPEKLSDTLEASKKHLLSLISADKTVVFDEVTYHDIIDIINRIKESQYFEKEVTQPEEEVVADEEESKTEEILEGAEEVSQEVVTEEESALVEPATDELNLNEVASEDDSSEPTASEELPVQNGLMNGVTLPKEMEENGQGEFIFLNEEIKEVPVHVEDDTYTEPDVVEITPEIPETIDSSRLLAVETQTLDAGSPEFIPKNVISGNEWSADQPAMWEEPAVADPNGDGFIKVKQRIKNTRGNNYRGQSGRGGRGDYRGNYRGDGAYRGGGGYRGSDGGFRGDRSFRGDRGGRGGDRDDRPRGRGNYSRGGRGGRGGNDNYNRPPQPQPQQS